MIATRSEQPSRRSNSNRASPEVMRFTSDPLSLAWSVHWSSDAGYLFGVIGLRPRKGSHVGGRPRTPGQGPEESVKAGVSTRADVPVG